jgi:hypothetical protein
VGRRHAAKLDGKFAWALPTLDSKNIPPADAELARELCTPVDVREPGDDTHTWQTHEGGWHVELLRAQRRIRMRRWVIVHGPLRPRIGRFDVVKDLSPKERKSSESIFKMGSHKKLRSLWGQQE